MEIPKDLQDQVNTLKALSTIYSLLTKSYLPCGHDQMMDQSLKFIETLHKQLTEETLSHKDAELVPELKQLMSEKQNESEKETTNV